MLLDRLTKLLDETVPNFRVKMGPSKTWINDMWVGLSLSRRPGLFLTHIYLHIHEHTSYPPSSSLNISSTF